jgi:amidase
VGPITKDVGDAARLLSVIAGPDAADPATGAIPPSLSLDFEAPLASATLAGKRIGVIRSFGSFGGAIDTTFEAELRRMRSAGTILVDVSLPDPTFGAYEHEVLLYEFKAGISAYLASHAHSGQPATLAELIAYNDANASVVMPYFGQEVFLAAQRMGDLTTPAYIAAKKAAHTAAADAGITAALAANNLDVLVTPTSGDPWLTTYDGGDRASKEASPYPAAAGFPHLTVPMRPPSQSPAGMSFIGGAWKDGEVLAIGYAYERLRAGP